MDETKQNELQYMRKSFRYAAQFMVAIIRHRDDDDAGPETVVYNLSVSHVIMLVTLLAVYTYICRELRTIVHKKIKNNFTAASRGVYV